jgi:hypothetical protein
MSRRCRDSLYERSPNGNKIGDGGCGCGRITNQVVVPCTEPILYGDNILLDPTFDESFSDPAGKGEDFPQLQLNAGYWSDSSYADPITTSGLYWSIRNANGSGFDPIISSEDPLIGLQHIKIPDPSATSHILQEAIRPLNLKLCNLFDSNGNHLWMTGIGLQGDLISMSYYMKKDASGNKEVRPYLEVEFFRADADSNGFASNLSTGLTYPILTDSYSQYVFQTFIPANTRYCSPNGWKCCATTLGAPS